MAGHLESRQGAAKGLPLFHVAHGLIQSQLGGTVGGHRQDQALHLEVAHDAVEATVLRTDQIFRRHPAILKKQLRGIGGPPAHLLQLAAHGKAWRTFLDQQQADATIALVTGTHRHRVIVRAHTAGDESLGAVDHIVVAIAHRTGAQVGHIGPTIGFGNGQGRDLLPTDHLRHHLLLHGIAAPLPDRRQTNIQRPQAGAQPPGRTPHQLLAGSNLHEHIFAGTTELFRGIDAQNAGIRGFVVKLAGELTGFFPIVHVGQDFPFHEFANGLAHHLVGIIEIIQRAHRASFS